MTDLIASANLGRRPETGRPLGFPPCYVAVSVAVLAEIGASHVALCQFLTGRDPDARIVVVE
jgi:hypothetical protein